MTTTFVRLPARALLALILALVAGALVPAPPAQAQKVKPIFFGMHDSAIAGGSVPGVATGSVRLWDSGVTWRQIETSDNVFQWDGLDVAVQTAEAAGVRPMLVLGQTPSFHALDPGASGFYGAGANSMPAMAAWKRYVTQVATRYGNRLDYQIWNEPNVSGFWTGSVGQMAKLTAAASKTIRNVVGKQATVVGPSFPLRLTAQRRWFDKYWSAKADNKPMSSYLRVVAINLYPEAKQAPEAQVKLLNVARKAIPKSARKKPMWNTEINYGLINGVDAAKEISEAKQAAYVARTLVLNAASPIRRMFWYSWRVGAIANTQLVQDDGTTLTRAGAAWGVARSWLLGTDTKSCQQAKRGKLRGLYTCTATKGRQEVRRIYWKPSGRAVTVKTHRTTTSSTNLAGETRSHRGSTRLKVGQAPVMVSSRR